MDEHILPAEKNQDFFGCDSMESRQFVSSMKLMKYVWEHPHPLSLAPLRNYAYVPCL